MIQNTTAELAENSWLTMSGLRELSVNKNKNVIVPENVITEIKHLLPPWKYGTVLFFDISEIRLLLCGKSRDTYVWTLK